jgi:hypothetical protein
MYQTTRRQLTENCVFTFTAMKTARLTHWQSKLLSLISVPLFYAECKRERFLRNVGKYLPSCIQDGNNFNNS